MMALLEYSRRAQMDFESNFPVGNLILLLWQDLSLLSSVEMVPSETMTRNKTWMITLLLLLLLLADVPE